MPFQAAVMQSFKSVKKVFQTFFQHTLESKTEDNYSYKCTHSILVIDLEIEEF